MPVAIEPTAPLSLSTANLVPRGRVFPSPTDWRDQCLYFLLPDRFSDGAEDGRPTFDRANPAIHHAPNKAVWMDAGKRFQGGTLRGITSKLNYLHDLGVTTLWIGPVWRQRKDLETYHGYGIQNFLDVDPRFGTRQDLRNLVDAAHDKGMYVLLDVIYNHSGNNWFYDDKGTPQDQMPYRFAPQYLIKGWRSATGQSIPIGSVLSTDDAVWPQDFQDLDWYTRAGKIGKWDPEAWEDPHHPSNEFRRGDFFDLKDLKTSELEAPSDKVLTALIDVYRYWIALSDCDGFRIDTVKHVSFNASKHFCGGVREYAESIGKDNFLLLGEVTGGENFERNYLDVFGRNLDAVLDIGEPAKRLAEFVKGGCEPSRFFNQFGGHDILGSHRETGRYHVAILDDHDMVARDGKRRFPGKDPDLLRLIQTAHAAGAQLTTLGMPCVYYGTEQGFDGTQDRHDVTIESRDSDGKIPFADRYIRESMFGGTFGAFETNGCHFFDPTHPTYRRISAIARIRNRMDAIGLALRRGRQYLRETSILGRPFSYPGAGELVAWSRLLYRQEVVIALNTNASGNRGAEVTVDTSLHPVGSTLTLLYRGDWSDAQLSTPPVDQTMDIRHIGNRAIVRIDLPPMGMLILA